MAETLILIDLEGRLYTSDGTATGTTSVSVNGAYSNGIFGNGEIPDFAILNGVAYFAGHDDSHTFGPEGLWSSGGTTATTIEITGINNANTSGGLLDGSADLISAFGELLFDGLDSNGIYNLWASNGQASGTSEVAGIGNTYAGGLFDQVANPDFTFFDGSVVFEGRDTAGIYGLWVTSNGTTASETSNISGANSGGIFAAVGEQGTPDFTVLGNGDLIFSGVDSSGHLNIWVMTSPGAAPAELTGVNGAAEQGLVGGTDSPPNFTAWDNGAVFQGEAYTGQSVDSHTGQTVYEEQYGYWFTNGSASGTFELPIPLSSDDISPIPDFAVLNGELIFAGVDQSEGNSLWVMASPGGTPVELTGITGASFSLAPTNLTTVGNYVYFTGNDSNGDTGLWRTDGTVKGTVEIKVLTSGVSPADVYMSAVTLGGSAATAPTITGTRAGQTTTSEARLDPFSGVTIGDTNGSSPTDTLTITLSGSGGTLDLTGGTNGVYTLAAAPANTITSELDSLVFTPNSGAPGTSNTTTFILSDVSSAGTSASDSTTTVIDNDPVASPYPAVPGSNIDEWILTDGEWAASAQPGSIPSGYQVAGTGDFTGNGTSDILWQNPTTGDTQEWLINNGGWAGTVDLGVHPGNYQIAGVGDFTGNGIDDVLWTSVSGSGQVQTDIWELGPNGQWAASVSPGSHPAGYQVVGVGDFTGNGTDDILWQNPTTGDVDEWQLSNGKWAASVDLGSHPGSGWQIAGVGDFTGNGIDDILWTNSSGGQVQTDIWELGSNGQWVASVSPGSHPAGYQVAGIGDFTGNGTNDILWQNSATGDIDEWQIAGGKWAASVDLGAHPGNTPVSGVGNLTGGGTSDILFHTSS